MIPGDIILQNAVLSSTRGSIDLSGIYNSIKVYENIFVPTMTGEIQVFDGDGIFDQLKLSGDETLQLDFSHPGGTTATHKFSLAKLNDISSVSTGLKAKTYSLQLVSEEAFHAKTNFVQKNYEMNIHSMVQDMVKTYLKSSKNVNVEETNGSQKILIPNFNPFKSIDMVRKRAVSSQNQSSAFLFFENRHNSGDQQFSFMSLEGLFKGSIIKSFAQDPTAMTSIYNNNFSNILTYSEPQNFSATDRIQNGGPRRIMTNDIRTQTYKYNDKKIDPTSMTTGGTGTYDSSTFQSKYYSPHNPPYVRIPNDASSGTRPQTNIPDIMAQRDTFIGTLSQNSLLMRVFGDTTLTAGAMISAALPAKTETDDQDELMSGKMMISRICHTISGPAEGPRYVCNMELLKGNRNEGV